MSRMIYVKSMSLSELYQHKYLLKSLRPQMWSNKDKLHKLQYLIDKVDYQIQEELCRGWVRTHNITMF